MTLQMKDVSFNYNHSDNLLTDASLTIHKGEIVSLMGPSGSGKSTLAQILAGIMTPSSGKVCIHDQDIHDIQSFKPVQWIHQHPENAVNPRWRVRKILNEAGKVDQSVQDELGIDSSWMNRWPNELSGGQLQRICIGRALQPRLEFLIADEMTTMLDAIGQVKILRFLDRLVKEEAIGILFISHDRALVEQFSDRIIFMNQLH